jgi:hypothetical protein
MKRTPAERGNVMFYILIAVALLAALIFAVAQSGRGNIQQVSEEKARLFATEIIQYTGTMANGVAQLRLRGVRDTEISFDNPVVSYPERQLHRRHMQTLSPERRGPDLQRAGHAMAGPGRGLRNQLRIKRSADR